MKTYQMEVESTILVWEVQVNLLGLWMLTWKQVNACMILRYLRQGYGCSWVASNVGFKRDEEQMCARFG
jgi:hypothetical protein